MANQVKLQAEKREGVGRGPNRRLRQQELIPAVLYGAHCSPENLQLQKKPLESILAHAANEHMLVDLEITGAKKRSALIQSVQHDPITTEILHVDLMEVAMNETISSAVPLESVGTPEGVKNGGGLLEVLLRELEIECLPKDLPDIIEFDVSALRIGDSLHVKDLPLPKGVTATSDADVTVALVAEPTVKAEAEEEETAAAAPEVIKEKPETES